MYPRILFSIKKIMEQEIDKTGSVSSIADSGLIYCGEDGADLQGRAKLQGKALCWSTLLPSPMVVNFSDNS